MLSRLFHYLLSEQQFDYSHAGSKFDDRQLLKSVCRCYDLQNLTYIYSDTSAPSSVNPKIKSTYSAAWERAYEETYFKKPEPIVFRALNDRTPFDWREPEKSKFGPSNFVAEARKLTDGKNGFTVPVQGKGETGGFVSMISRLEDAQWLQYYHRYRSEFICIAYFLHERFSPEPPFADEQDSQLTDRELEALHWAAVGKTSEETAIILGVTKRVVYFHITNAKIKLQATTKSHAVAKTISVNITDHVF